MCGDPERLVKGNRGQSVGGKAEKRIKADQQEQHQLKSSFAKLQGVFQGRGPERVNEGDK